MLSTAILAVRGAMQERRERAEQAFREAQSCALACAKDASAARTEELRQCSGTVRSAAELSLELPEHNGQQMEVQAALDELVTAIESRDEHRLSSAIDRSSRAGSALGW